MKTNSILQVIAAAGIAFAAVGTAVAQTTPYALKIDAMSKTITPGGSTAFEINIINQTAGDMDLYVTRADVTFPNENWYSSFCFNGNCFDPSVTAPPVAHIAPGGSTQLELTVVGVNSLPNESASVKVHFNTALGLNSVDKEFTVSVSAGAGVGSEAPIAEQTHAYPNPASTFTQIAVPASLRNARDLSATLYNASGERVADMTEAARGAIGSGTFTVDLSGLQTGAYYYRLAAGSTSAKGSFVVVR